MASIASTLREQRVPAHQAKASGSSRLMEKCDGIDTEWSTAKGTHNGREVRSKERGFRAREAGRQGHVETELV
jgi:hypothetical protein